MTQACHRDDRGIYLWHAAIAKQNRGPLEKRCWTWLTENERRRTEKFRLPSSQNQHLVGKGMARWLLSNNKSNLSQLQFKITDQGKPYVDQPADAKRPFNLSHTDGLAVCLIGSRDYRCVGVDVERLDRNTSPDLANRYFSPPEVAKLKKIQEPQAKKQMFLKIWTLKEAFIKAIGTGLRTPLSAFAFENLNSPNPSIEFLDPSLNDGLNWNFYSFQPRAGFVCSTAVGSALPSDLTTCKIRSFEEEIDLN